MQKSSFRNSARGANSRIGGPRLLWAAGAACALVIGAGLTSSAYAQGAAATAADESTQDVLVLKNGTRLEGKIISETDTAIRFKGSFKGMALPEQDYLKSDIAEIQRGTKKEADAKAPGAGSPGTPAATTPDAKPAQETGVSTEEFGDLSGDSKEDKKTADAIAANPNATRIYVIPCGGIFGEDVSQTPLERAMKDAMAQKASIVVLMLDSKAIINPRTGESIDEDLAWDMTSRVEQIFPVFTETMPKVWREAGVTPPRVAVVCRRALGAAAFFPLGFKEVYFRSDGRMGGIGGLSEMFEGRGDDVVREKQRSLRLGHVEGWANYGGYDVRLVRAMARREDIVSMRLVGGKAELLHRMPENPSEELLTDDGKESRQDTMQDYYEGTGNDTLTLDARVAMLLGVSKGTVDNDQDLIIALDAGRDAVLIKDRGERIMKQWSRGVDSSKKQFRKLYQEFQEARQDTPNNYDNRTKFRGIRKQKLVQMKTILQRWEEALGLWTMMNGIPGIPMIETEIKRIELQQMADRPDPR